MPAAEDERHFLSVLGVTDPLPAVHFAATTLVPDEVRLLASASTLSYALNTKLTPAHAGGMFEITNPLNLKLD